MTDRWKGFVVALEQDLREDDAASTLEAIRHIRGVLSVEPIISDGIAQILYERAKYEVRDKVYGVLKDL